MADDEERQRRLERKRAYNRRLSAKTRQRTRDQIASLAAKAEFHSSRADNLEKKNAELTKQVQALSAVNQMLTERLEHGAGAARGGGGGGLASTMNGLVQSSSIARPDLTSMTGSRGGFDPRYLQMDGLLSGTTGVTGGASVDQSLDNSSIQNPMMLLRGGHQTTPYQSRDILSSLAGLASSTQELDVLIRLITMRNGNRPLPGSALDSHASSAGILASVGRGGFSAAAPTATSSSTDAILPQLLAATQPGAIGRERALSTLAPDMQARILSLLLVNNHSPPSIAAALPQDISQHRPTTMSIAEINNRERQIALLALLERISRSQSTAEENNQK